MPEKLGRYEIVEELGRGAMGVIYKAKDPAISRFVAIKTIRLGDFTDPSHIEELRSRLVREAQSAGALSHPNIITIFDVGEEEGLSYFAMELVEGANLENLIETNQQLEEATIIHIARQAADAIGFAHRHGIVHRDIKPANIMLTADGRVKVADFGIAKVGSTKMTQTGMLLGSPSYMAPEHFLGQALDGRSDIFALGIVLYELVTGQPPFVAENLGTLSYKIVHEDIVPPIRLKPSLHPQLNAIIVKALARDPAERYQSAEELCGALDAISSDPSSAVKQTVLSSVAASAAAPALKTEPLSKTVAIASPRKGRFWSRAAALLLILIGAGAVAAMVYPEQFHETVQIAQSKLQPWLERIQPQNQNTATNLPESTEPTKREESPSSETGRTADSVVSSTPEMAPVADAPVPEKAGNSAPHIPTPNQAVSLQTAKVPVIPPSTGSGIIQVSSAPIGAEVVFDDQSSERWLTPYSFLNLAKGRHTIEVRKSGYLPEKRIVILLGDESQRINVVLTMASGVLKVITLPSGAQISVDGELKSEVTPASLKLQAGARRILLHKEGFRDMEQVIEIEDNTITTLNQQLAPATQ